VARRVGGLGRIVRRRRRQLLGFTLLIILAAAVLGSAAWADEGTYLHEVLVNVGASVVIVAMSYAIFDPIFEEIRRARVQEQPYFDDVSFCDNVGRATREVRIMDTCNHMLEGPNRTALLGALSEAARRRASVRILLLDPDSIAAQHRAREISPVNVRNAIMENLRYLHECRELLPPDAQERFQVRIYNALPSIQFFQHDFRALVAFFPPGGRASSSPHLEVAIETSLGEFVSGRFDDLWDHARTRSLDAWRLIDVIVWNEERRLTQCLLGYLDLGERLFLDATPIQDLLMEHGRPHVRCQLSDPQLPAGRQGILSVESVPDPPAGPPEPESEDAPPTPKSLQKAFDIKYGTHSANGPARVIVELGPREPAGDA
jgi:hypothetical protein